MRSKSGKWLCYRKETQLWKRLSRIYNTSTKIDVNLRIKDKMERDDYNILDP